MDDSAITCDEIIESYEEETKTISTNFIAKTCKTQKLYILLTFLLIIIAVSIYCYLIKYRAKKHLLPLHVTNNELKQVSC